MSEPDLPRILVVDDEEAILETMTYTFMDVYDVVTATDGQQALALLEEKAPISVVITDQRMPQMTGVELLAEICKRHPEVVRIMLTGFADADATIQAINDGHIYAYVNKPWESSELKQVVKRAIEHHRLSVENSRLVADLRRTNLVLHAVMDRLDVGAVALDPEGVVQAINRPARKYLKLSEDVEGRSLAESLRERGLETLSELAAHLGDADGGSFEDMELRVDGTAHRIRVSAQSLLDPGGETFGRVVLFKEISHEPLRRQFEEIISRVAQKNGALRDEIVAALAQLGELASELSGSAVDSPHMGELLERVSRSRTALQNWLDVDDTLAAQDYPDAQVLLDRMRVATQRWPYPDELPPRVRELASHVEAYYESGENRKQRIL